MFITMAKTGLLMLVVDKLAMVLVYFSNRNSRTRPHL